MWFKNIPIQMFTGICLFSVVISKLTSDASIARSISSSQTLDQNSIPWRATSSMSLFIASIVIFRNTKKGREKNVLERYFSSNMHPDSEPSGKRF